MGSDVLNSFVIGLCVFLFACHYELKADDARTLPKGRFRTQLVSGFSSIQNQFNDAGTSVSLGAPYSQNINTQFLSLMKPESAKQIAQLRAVLPSLSDDLEIARLGLNMNCNVITNAFALEYGVTDRLSIGVMLPIIYGRTEVKAMSETSEEFQNLIDSSPTALKAALTSIRDQTSIENINRLMTAELGYSNGLQSWSGAGIGDLEIGLKYNYYKAHRFRLTFKGGLRLPTGREDDPDLLFDMGFGGGQMDVGAYHYLDFDVTSKISLTAEAGYVAQLAHQQNYRVPLTADVSVSPIVAKYNRNPGDYVETGFEVNYSPFKVLKLSSKYRLFHKFKDRFRSNENQPTKILEENTNQQLHQAQLSIGYSNLSRVRTGKDRFPYEVTAFYYHPLTGKNVTEALTGGLQLKSYF